ncbi:MAG: voltage-gated potassium channel [bacterium]|jgi:voltage-gated potassium channel
MKKKRIKLHDAVWGNILTLTEIFKKLYPIFFPAVVVMMIGTFGYTLIEGWSLFDSFYMTIITLTTVGFQELHILSKSGRVFTIFLLITGLGNITYIISHLSRDFIQSIFNSELVKKKMQHSLDKMTDHYIICGYGRIGKIICEELQISRIPFVIVDAEADPTDEKATEEIPYVKGDASNEDVLKDAGIFRAKGLVSVVHSEADNVFITLTARAMKPDIFIIARHEIESTRKKLLRAGANRVVNPYHIGSVRISQMITKPTVSSILERASQRGEFNLSIEELYVDGSSFLDGKTLRDTSIRDSFNVIIIAIEHEDGTVTFNPTSTHMIAPSDRLVMIGNQEGLNALRNHLSSFSNKK